MTYVKQILSYKNFSFRSEQLSNTKKKVSLCYYYPCLNAKQNFITYLLTIHNNFQGMKNQDFNYFFYKIYIVNKKNPTINKLKINLL